MPNFLTIIRILLSIFITCIVIFFPGKLIYIISFILFCLAGFTDFFDGWYARRNDKISDFGKMLDPIADKILSISSLIALMINGIIEGFNIIPALIIIYREIFVSGLREYLGEKSIKVSVTNQSKLKTATQFIAISGFLISPVISPDIYYFNYLLSFLLSLSALTSISTGFNYFKLTSEFLKKK